jgi:hypothetical protein
MADRYPNRPFPADDYDRGSDRHGAGSAGGESDPLAELARLIGQTDPFGSSGRANPAPPPQRAAVPRESYQPQPQYQAPVEEDEAPAGPPAWMQRANIQRQSVQEMQRAAPVEYPPEDDGQEYAQDYAQDYASPEYPTPVHPLRRAAVQPVAHHDDYREDSYQQAEEQQADPSRYDDALYGQLESGAQDFQREPAYPDDPYAYQDGYEDEPEERPKRRGGLLMVVAVLALAVVGTGAAFAYRTYVGSARSGEPPIIKADNGPIKVLPAPTDSGKTPDRMPAGDGTEKLVPREEAPVDINAKTAGPRVVFPPLNTNTNPPSAASVSSSTMVPANGATGGVPSNGTLPNNEPRKIKTLSVHGDQADASTAPMTTAPPQLAKPPVASKQSSSAPPAMRNPPSAGSNAPLSLSPDSAQASLPPAASEQRTRIAASAPTQIASAADSGSAAEGHFLVQVSSQKTEADAQSSYRALQRKFPDALGSHTPVIKRADLGGDKGTVFRAMVGPFASREEAKRFCTSYQTAGGQCYVP